MEWTRNDDENCAGNDDENCESLLKKSRKDGPAAATPHPEPRQLQNPCKAECKTILHLEQKSYLQKE